MTSIKNSICIFLLLSFSTISSSYSSEVEINADELKMAAKAFKGYCSKCHGKEGKGDGRMNRLYLKLKVHTPTSFEIGFFETRPMDYLVKMIRDGGEKQGRSKYMPPFKGELTDEQIKSLAKLINVTGKMRKMPKVN